jgi:hypothetical protein
VVGKQARIEHIISQAYLLASQKLFRCEVVGSNEEEICVFGYPIGDSLGWFKCFTALLTLAEGEMVKASFAQETGETMWNVIQAYTGSARAPELTVEAAYRLERVGGQILALVK